MLWQKNSPEGGVGRRKEAEIACAPIARCSWTARAETEDEIMAKIREHVAEAHDMPDLTPELLRAVRLAIKGN